MPAPMKKTNGLASNENGKKFPSEVYEPHDDVSKEAVAFLRERVRGKIEGRNWKRVEGVAPSNAC
jgi:hypothetical protein